MEGIDLVVRSSTPPPAHIPPDDKASHSLYWLLSRWECIVFVPIYNVCEVSSSGGQIPQLRLIIDAAYYSTRGRNFSTPRNRII